jgi:DNA mismatch repair protein MutS
VQHTSGILAGLDVLQSFAHIAEQNNYKRPTINNERNISVTNGRHPVIERFLDMRFVPNDTNLTDLDNWVAVITGPNMAGKSTFMRQTALIVLMSQIGSFVPADKADLCVVDKIFTRIGAADDLATGQSTFMVEMNEVANILNNATRDSLIILDEIGRGTSTYDGLSIAWSVLEYIAEKLHAKTLFATHYHELTELEGTVDGVRNYYITIKEQDDDIVFLYKIAHGGNGDENIVGKSYGIQVAKLAGLPSSILNRAKTIYERHDNQLFSLSEIKTVKKPSSGIVMRTNENENG